MLVYYCLLGPTSLNKLYPVELAFFAFFFFLTFRNEFVNLSCVSVKEKGKCSIRFSLIYEAETFAGRSLEQLVCSAQQQGQPADD